MCKKLSFVFLAVIALLISPYSVVLEMAADVFDSQKEMSRLSSAYAIDIIETGKISASNKNRKSRGNRRKKVRIKTQVNCKDRPDTISVYVINRTNYDARVFLFFRNFDEFAFIPALGTKELQLAFVLTQDQLTFSNDARQIEFTFVPVGFTGEQLQGLKVRNIDYVLAPKKSRCLGSITFELGELVFGKLSDVTPAPTPTPQPFFDYSAYIQPGQYTCCLNPDNSPTYKFLFKLSREVPLGAIVLASGFDSVDSLIAWACNRNIYFHYWASNYTNFGSYVVSGLPCAINS
ncbi:MAG: hypothetical protein DCC75_07850 [Proteobacteria bacterium]|nr:MAG: hypothetical protein DCC75_07850 [Pseudomonadota bacterium]